MIIRFLDVPVFAFIIFGNHGLSGFGKAILGTFYWAFPLFVLGRCPLHVLVKWIFEGRKTGSLVIYMKKAYGKKKFVLMFIFFFVISATIFILVLRTI